MTTGEKIKFLRKSLGMNAETLAKKCNCSPASIYRYENGEIENFSHEVLIALAYALHTTPAYLLGVSDEDGEENDEEKELKAILEAARTDSDLRALFSLSRTAKKRDVIAAISLIENLKSRWEIDDE